MPTAGEEGPSNCPPARENVELAFGPIAPLACFRENISLAKSLIKLTIALRHSGKA
jgi:hypothetical protein